MNKKIISLLLCVIMLTAVLAGCGGSSYREDVPLAELVEVMDSAAGGSEAMTEASGTYFESMMKLTSQDYTEACVKMDSQGININEYGVFKTAGEAEAKALAEKLEEYLAYRIAIWAPEYMPEEFPKLEDAQVTVCGSYLMYSILDDSGRAQAAEGFEAALKG